MGIYHDYVAQSLTPQRLDEERKAQLARLSALLGADVLTYAARISPTPMPLPTSVVHEDLLPFVDMMGSLPSKRIAVVLETFGGIGEVGREMVEVLHDRFEHVSFVVPGTAKSTGTIMVLGGHEILMGPSSSLGPIDAQIIQEGKQFSADALIEGLNLIKNEVADTGKLNAAYVPILQRLSPGEIQNALNALEFARVTVRDWLTKYKFADWTKHSSGEPVTEQEKRERAYEISKALSTQGLWHTHGRSLRIQDLRALKLKITDYSEKVDLNDVISRYYALLRLTFDSGNAFKIFETPTATFVRRFNVVAPQQTQPSLPGGDQAPTQAPVSAVIEVTCLNCNSITPVQLDFDPGAQLRQGAVRFPDSGYLSCPNCRNQLDLRAARQQIEQQVGRPALSPQPRP